MESWILANEATLRLSAFLGIFTFVALGEWLAPRRQLSESKPVRWLNNLGIVFANTLILRAFMPVMAVGMAQIAGQRGWGLLNLWEGNFWVKAVLGVVLLDLAIYLQHVMVHSLPLLWRLHRMHHADLDYDVTNGARFHPLEILLSMGIKLSVVALLGPSGVAVICFEVLLNGTAMFNHGNLRLPLWLDRWLRFVVVTPDMHRVHHSVIRSETNSNYGFNSPWWDYLFGTYKAQPSLGHVKMTIGIEEFRSSRELWIDRLLSQPFRGHTGGYPINGEQPSPDSLLSNQEN